MKLTRGSTEEDFGATVSACPIVASAASKAAFDAVRSRGEIRLGFVRSGDGTTLSDFYQAGCLKARMPHTVAGEAPCVVMINTGGGIVDGDALIQRARWGEGAHATVTGQAAEKVYRAPGQGARIDTELQVSAGADAEWLPQETILFDRARLTRSMRVDMAGDAAFTGLEAVVLGRAAMGEVVRDGMLDDRWRIRRDGRLVYADALRIDGPVDRLMARRAVGAGARAMATLIHVSTRAASLLGAVRDAIAGAVGSAAASAWNGMLVVRFLARDGAALRHDVVRALDALRGGRPLSRVWSC